MTTREDPPRTFGPMVHRFGHRRPDEWDIPFSEWTTLRATDVDGREHIFEVPTAALAESPREPGLDLGAIAAQFIAMHDVDDGDRAIWCDGKCKLAREMRAAARAEAGQEQER